MAEKLASLRKKGGGNRGFYYAKGLPTVNTPIDFGFKPKAITCMFYTNAYSDKVRVWCYDSAVSTTDFVFYSVSSGVNGLTSAVGSNTIGTGTWKFTSDGKGIEFLALPYVDWMIIMATE